MTKERLVKIRRGLLVLAAAVWSLCLVIRLAETAPGRQCAVANGDAQRVMDVVTTNASGVVTSATGKFVCPGDAGKTVFLRKAGVNRLAVNTTTISVCTNATTVTLTANANANDTNVEMVWATGDSTSAITTQVTACKSDTASTYHQTGTFVGNIAGTVTLSGGYIVSGCIYDVNKNGQIPSIAGGGADNTVLFLTPTLTACTDPSTVIYASGYGFSLSGIGIEAGGTTYTTGSASAAITVTNATQWNISNVNVLNYGWTGTVGAAIRLSGVQYGYSWNVIVQGGGGPGYLCDISGAASELNTWFCSNSGTRNLRFGSPSGRTPTSSPLLWIAGGADECSDANAWCTVVDTNSEADIIGAVIFSALRIENGGVAYLTNVNVGQFNTTNRVQAADISSTGAIYSEQCTWRGTRGGKIVNRGTFTDGLGNIYQDCNGTSCTTIKAAQIFAGNQPVTR